MKVYKTSKRYNSRTGKPEGEEREVCKVLCDYTGEEIDIDAEERPFYSTKFTYDDGSEQDWYYDDLGDLIKAMGDKDEGDIDEFYVSGLIAEDDFVYSIKNAQWEDHSISLVEDWIKGRRGKYKDCRNIAHMARRKRLELMIELLKNGKYTAEELGLI